MLRRVLAVVVDFFALYLVWIGVGLTVVALKLPVDPGVGILVYLVAIDLPLTAAFGLSPGRTVAGIRVVRLSDGRVPGLRRATLRILLVVLTGPFVFLYWTVAHRAAQFWGGWLGSFRLLWDVAVGTTIVRSARSARPPVAVSGPDSSRAG